MGLRTDMVIGTLQEKMKGIGEGSMILMNSTQATLKAAGADEMMNNLQEKLKQPSLTLENSGLLLISWFDKIIPPETREQILHWLRVVALFVVAVLVLLGLIWCLIYFIGCFIGCIGSLIGCIGYSLLWIGRCIGYLLLYIGRCIGGVLVAICRCCGITMMKAPGMIFWIPRFLFEACPRGCFQAFRALGGLCACLKS